MSKHVKSKAIGASLLTIGFVLAGCQAQGQSDQPSSHSDAPIETQSSTQDLTGIPDSDLAFSEYFDHRIITLDNGLRVIMHKDDAVPFVSVALYFHVGSKDEPEGKTGFAHLFEHLLFNGTPNNPGEFFQTLDKIGGSSVNGTTNSDRTNYYETVPASSLEALLWIEADRMNNITQGITKQKIQTQIEVVKNEKGLGENQPFGTSFYTSIEALYPKGHPYHHSTIGSIEDLESASIEDVEAWFDKYYGARNALLSISGDFDYDEAEALVRKHFAHIKPGPSITQIQELPIKRVINSQHTVYDVAPGSGVQRFYSLPPLRDKADMAVSMAAEYIAGQQYSPMVDELVNKRKLATAAGGVTFQNQMASTSFIDVDAAEGVDLETITDAMDEIMANILEKPPTQEDLNRQIGEYESSLVGLSGNNLGKAINLGEGLLYHNDALRELRLLEWMKQTTPEEVHAAAIEWFSGGHHTAYHVGHEGPYTTVDPTFDVNAMPAFGGATPLIMPKPSEFQLSNGLNVVHTRNGRTPEVQMVLILPTGQNDLSPIEKIQANAVMDIVNNGGVGNRNHTEVAGLKTELGMFTLSDMRGDHTFMFMDAGTKNFERSLDIWLNEILTPEFRDDDIQRYLRQMKEGLTKSLKRPSTVALEKTMFLLRGEDAYITRRERLDALESVNRDTLLKSHQSWMGPNKATLFVTGDMPLNGLKPMLEEKFGSWDSRVELRPAIIHDLPPPLTRPRFILVNDEGSTQSDVYAARRIDFEYGKDETIIDYADKIFGGSFNSRLNLNIREDKGWSYGVGSRLSIGEDGSEWSAGGTVTGENTVDAIKEMLGEMQRMTTSDPIRKKELDDTVAPDLKTVARLLESNRRIGQSLIDSHLLGRPYNYPETEQERLQALDVKDLNVAAKSYLKTDDLVWMVVGDLSLFEDELRAADLGDIEVYDLDGKRVR